MQRKRPTVIALDFDGVLHSYTSGWTGPVPEDPPVASAVWFVCWLLEQGYELWIHTARVHPRHGRKEVEAAEQGIRRWLVEHDFPTSLHCGLITHEKGHADMFIDDRGCRFDGDFLAVRDMIDSNPELHPWYDRRKP